jgi:cytidyltransferase-like protein
VFFGGSFNPPHPGHMDVMFQAIQKLALKNINIDNDIVVLINIKSDARIERENKEKKFCCQFPYDYRKEMMTYLVNKYNLNNKVIFDENFK